MKKVFITRDWHDKSYEIWNHDNLKWDDTLYYSNVKGCNYGLFISDIEASEAKKMFGLTKHLKKREIIEATMTFKIKK